MSDLYERIEEKALERGMRVGYVAVKAGVSKGRLSDLKNGRSQTLSAENLKRIADVLGVPVNYLMNGDEGPARAVQVNLDRKYDLHAVFSKFTERELIRWMAAISEELQRRRQDEEE